MERDGLSSYLLTAWRVREGALRASLAARALKGLSDCAQMACFKGCSRDLRVPLPHVGAGRLRSS